jgi:hypothetical protein
MYSIGKVTLVVFLFFTAIVSYAGNYTFLNNTAITFFRGDDKNLMALNLDKALDAMPDGKKSIWRNPATGSWGYAVPSKTSYSNRMKCRNLTIFNSANSVTGLSTFRFCKIGGEWRIIN